MFSKMALYTSSLYTLWTLSLYTFNIATPASRQIEKKHYH